MTLYTVKGKTILHDQNINAEFTREQDAIDYIKKLGAQKGISAQIVKTEEGDNYKYSYAPNRARTIKLLESHSISYELDDNLNIKIIF